VSGVYYQNRSTVITTIFFSVIIFLSNFKCIFNIELFLDMTDAVNIGQMENTSVWVTNSNDHPLQTAWAFWYDKKQTKKTDGTEFRNKLHKIGSFDTVESFWKLYLFLKRPSKLEMNVNLYCFRDGPNIAPMWEAFPR
jgi:hypothetical protein